MVSLSIRIIVPDWLRKVGVIDSSSLKGSRFTHAYECPVAAHAIRWRLAARRFESRWSNLL